MADQVLRMPDADVAAGPNALASRPPAVQRLCTECEEEQVQRQALDTDDEGEVEEEDDARLSRKAVSDRAPPLPPAVGQRIPALRRDGQPLDVATRRFFEPRFGHDFSQVRIHADHASAQTARALQAKAYTLGSDIVFGKGRYDPKTAAGKHLLAHELTHVVQQRHRQSARDWAEASPIYRQATGPGTVPCPWLSPTSVDVAVLELQNRTSGESFYVTDGAARYRSRCPSGPEHWYLDQIYSKPAGINVDRAQVRISIQYPAGTVVLKDRTRRPSGWGPDAVCTGREVYFRGTNFRLGSNPDDGRLHIELKMWDGSRQVLDKRYIVFVQSSHCFVA